MTETEKQYYLPSEISPAIASAGAPSITSFYRAVRSGKIHKVRVEGYGEPVYQGEDVRKFLRGEFVAQRGGSRRRKSHDGGGSHSRGHTSVYTPEPLIDVAHQDDLPHIYLMESERLGFDQAIFPNIVWSWLGKNDHSYWFLSDPANRRNIWATLGVLPLPEELIFKLLRGEMTVRDIKPDDVLPYNAAQDLTCYIVSSTVTSDQVYQSHLTLLMQQLMAYWCELAPDTRISRLYASIAMGLEETPGRNLVKEFFFSPLYEFGEDRWELRFDHYNPSPIVQALQRCVILNPQEKEKSSMVALMPAVKRSPDNIKKRVRNIRGLKPMAPGGYLTPNTRFRSVSSDTLSEDIRAIVGIGDAIFGASNVSDEALMSLFVSWWSRNSEIFHVLEVDKKIIGFTSLLPLPKDKIDAIIRGELRMSGITPDDILPFVPGEPVDLFVHVLGADPRINQILGVDPDIDQPKRSAGRFLIEGTMGMFHDFATRGIEIQAVYARSDTPDGIATSHGLGFDEVPAPLGVTKLVFELNVSQSDRPFLVDYRRTLAEHRAMSAFSNS